MSEDNYKTSKEWHSLLCPHTEILDPDGWDRRDFHQSFNVERITKEEFWARLCDSTVISKVDNI